MTNSSQSLFQASAAPLFRNASSPFAGTTARPESTPSMEVVREPSQLADSAIDWSQVYAIREEVTTAISGNDRIAEASLDDKRQYARTVIPHEVEQFSNRALRGGHSENVISPPLRPLYSRAVEEAIFGYGRWTPLMEDPDVEDIELRGYENAVMTYGDRIELRPRVADSNAELLAQVTYLAEHMATQRKTFSITQPALTLNLEDRFRLHAMGFDITDRPSIIIRQHKHTHVTLSELVDLELMPAHVADFLASCMIAGRSLVVSGGMGAGKTTLLRALAASLPPMRSIGVIETDPELFLHKLPNRHRVVNLLAREGSPEAINANGRPAGEFSLAMLLKESKRQRFEMVSVGEILGVEAALLFEAMQSGAGSFSTIHSQSAEATIERIVSAAAHGEILSPDDAYRQVTTLLNLIVYIRTIDTRHLTGGRFTRYIDKIIEIKGFQDKGTDGTQSSRPATHVVYSADAPDAPLQMTNELRRSLHEIGWRG